MPVGQLRFIVPEPERLSEQAVQQAYLTGFDPIPSSCRARFIGGELLVDRDGHESVKLNLPWQVDGFGRPLTATGTLMQRDRPYLLPLELARGRLNQLRNQLADWQMFGLEPSKELSAKIVAAIKHLTDAAVRQHEPTAASFFAQDALRTTYEAADLTAQCYADQSLTARHRSAAKLPIAFGTLLGRAAVDAALAPQLAALCNTAGVPLTWRDVATEEDRYHWEVFAQQSQWCRTQGLNTAAGPLVRLDERGFPAWLSVWQDDVEAVLAFVAEYVAQVVQEFRGKVSFWHAVSFDYCSRALALRDEDKIRIVARVLDTVRRHDPDTPQIVSFTQPWAEYLRKMPPSYAPIHIADHLVRSGLPLAALGLELKMGYHPDGSYHRDPLELSRLIDSWSSLGLPLYVYLTIPAGEQVDPKAESRTAPSPGAYHGGWSPAAQADWVRKYVPVLLAKPTVQGIAWQQWRDDEPHELPYGGLVDAHGAPKPALMELIHLRKQHIV